MLSLCVPVSVFSVPLWFISRLQYRPPSSRKTMVAKARGFDRVVRHVQDRHAGLPMDVSQHFEQAGVGLGVERAERLVEQQDARAMAQRPAQGDALRLAAAQAARLAVEQLRDAEQLASSVTRSLTAPFGWRRIDRANPRWSRTVKLGNRARSCGT